MGIIKHIENLRKRPHHERRRFALLYSGSITVVIFVVWLSVLLPGSASNAVSDRPDSALGKGLSVMYDEVKKGITEVKEETGWRQTAGAGAAASSTSENSEVQTDRVWDAPVSDSSDEPYDFGQ